MIQVKTGDIFAEDVQALVNMVNCVGVMGRGIALQFKKAFPENFKAYAEACKRGQVKPGKMFVFETGQTVNPRYIINFPTKRHWRPDSRMEDIEAGLEALAEAIRERNIESVAIPPLGCGLGGLLWRDVRPRIEQTLRGFDDLRAVVFEPGEAPEPERMRKEREAPKMTPGRAALVGLMRRYLDVLLDPFITLLEVHKLMYFMQVAGEPLRLKFKAAPYGPYAENLRHVLHKIEGHYIIGYADGSDEPDKQLDLIPGAVEDAEAFLDAHETTCRRFDRVADLVSGFESGFGLELLATVHWVMEHQNLRSADEVIERTYSWNERKKQFSRRQIRLAADRLADKGWIRSIG